MPLDFLYAGPRATHARGNPGVIAFPGLRDLLASDHPMQSHLALPHFVDCSTSATMERACRIRDMSASICQKKLQKH